MWSCGLSTHKSQNQRPYGTPGPDLASRLMCELTRSKCELTRSNGHPNYGCDPSAWCPDLRSALTRVGLGALQPVPERSAVEPAADSVDARGRAGVLVGLDGCEVRLCLPCARVRPSVPCVSRLPPVSFYRCSRVCPGSPRCLFTGAPPGPLFPGGCRPSMSRS